MTATKATKSALYAALGAGDLILSKARSVQVPRSFRALRREAQGRAGRLFTQFGDSYVKLAKRGKKTLDGIRTSPATKQAAEQAKAASSQAKTAVTSVKKAAAEVAEATKQAASKAV